MTKPSSDTIEPGQNWAIRGALDEGAPTQSSEVTQQVIDAMLSHGHVNWLGCRYLGAGDDWCELEIPWREDLAGDSRAQTIASGPLISLMDTACSIAAWRKIGAFQAQVTLDLRLDYLRPPRAKAGIIGRGRCYHLTRSMAFVRGIAHEGDIDDPVAQIVGGFMRFSGAGAGPGSSRKTPKERRAAESQDSSAPASGESEGEQ